MTEKPMNDARAEKSSGTASQEASQAAVSRQLKQYFDAITEEGIPDRFVELLEKLDQAEKAARGGAGKEPK